MPQKSKPHKIEDHLIMSKSKYRILWALDAFEDSPEVFKNSIRLIQSLSRQFAAEVEPVYVLGPKQLNLSFELSNPLTEIYAPAAIKALHHRLKSVEIPGLLPPQVLVNHHSSLRESASLLLTHAKNHETDMIVTGSHGRKGLNRVLLGGFAEELMLQASIPIMTIGSQEMDIPKGDRIQLILFPTDFREAAFPIFRQVVTLAERTGAQVTLLHVITRPMEPAFQSGVYLLSGGWIPYVDYPEEEKAAEAAARTSANRWIAEVSASGTPIEVVVDTHAPSVTESIFRHAEQKETTLIAMAAQSGRLSSAVLGSITRQIVRGSAHPVWVCRADA